MARLEVGIGATNKELKSVLADSETLVRNFANNLKNINVNLGVIRNFRSETNQASSALERQRVATEAQRTAAQRALAETRQWSLEQRKSKASIDAASGSYREAQQKLTALGRTIREQAGGFNLNSKAVQANIAQYRQLNAQLKAFDAAMGNHQRNVGNYGGVLGGIGNQLASVAAGYLSIQTAINGVNAAFNSAMKSDAIQASMTFILRNADDVSARLGRVEMSAERLGLGYLGLSATYRSFVGAANASNFSLFEAERIFDAVSNAAGKLKLSNEQVEGAFRALEQMISKGNVQAEELRGQLGERIPGAFAIAARAMGVTEKQLNKMLKDGDVLASELLPRLATELNNTFGLDQSEKVDSLQGSVNRLKNTFDVAIQEGNISKFFQSFVDGANFSLKSINELVNSNGWKEFLENFVMFTNWRFR